MSERFPDTLERTSFDVAFTPMEHMERLQAPFVHYLANDIRRVEALYEHEYGLPPIVPEDLPAEGTSERAELEARATLVADNLFLAEMGFVESSDVVRQAAREHPDKPVKMVVDLDGTVTPMVAFEAIGQSLPDHATIRFGLPYMLGELNKEIPISLRPQEPGQQTLSLAICSTRPSENLAGVADDIDAACAFLNTPVVDRTLSATSQQEIVDMEAFERNLTYEQACEILDVLNAELPGVDPKLQEALQYTKMFTSLGMRLTPADQEFAVGVVREFLGSVDQWSRSKIPAIAKLIHDNPDTVIAYFDDCDAPDLLQHDRLYCKQLGRDVENETKLAIGARFWPLDDPRLIDTDKKSRQVLAVMRLRLEKMIEEQALLQPQPNA